MLLQVFLVSTFLGYTCGKYPQTRRDVYRHEFSDIPEPNSSGGFRSKVQPSSSEFADNEFPAPHHFQTLSEDCQLPPDLIPPTNDIANSTLWELLEKTEKDLLIHNGDGVLLLGNTGSGKSTVLLTIAGDLKNLTVYVTIGGTAIILDAAQKIGMTTSSRTLVPELVYDSPNNLHFYDCPGFLDNRDYKADITANYLMKKATEGLTSVRPVFIVPEDSVKIGGTKVDFGSLVTSAVRMIKDLDKLQTGIGMIVTKVQNFDPTFNKERNDTVVMNSITRYLLQYRADEEEKLNPMRSISNDESNNFVRRRNVYFPWRLPNSFGESRAMDSQEMIRRKIKFVDILLQPNKISFMRVPTECGSFDKSKFSQDSRDKMTKLIRDDLKSVPINETDFGYAVSPDTTMQVSDLYKNLNTNMTDLMIELFTKLRTTQLELTLAAKDFFQVKAWLDGDYGNFTKTIEDLKSSKSPIEFGKKIYEVIVARGYEQKWGLDLIVQTRKFESYMDFFDLIAPEGVNDRKNAEWLEPLQTWVTVEVSGRKEWYNFLDNLRKVFAYFRFQSTKPSSVPKDIREIKTSLGTDGVIVSAKVIELYDQSITGGPDVILTSEDTNVLWEIVNEAFEAPKIQCSGSKMTVKGSFVKVTDFTEKDESFIKCGESPPSQVVVYATRKVFFDRPVTPHKSVNSNTELGIAAPEWEITAKVLIDLSGKIGSNGGSDSSRQIRSMTSEDYNGLQELTPEDLTYNFDPSNMTKWILSKTEAQGLRKTSSVVPKEERPEYIQEKCGLKPTPSNGGRGSDGIAGKHGGPGGNVIGLVRHVINADQLKIDVEGGAGGAGQVGVKGVDGQQGPRFEYREWRVCRHSSPCYSHCPKGNGVTMCRKNDSKWVKYFDACYRKGSGVVDCFAAGCSGGKGGRGGDGGAGGKGGSGGQAIIVVSDGSELPQIHSNGGSKGKDGSGGSGGLGGLQGIGAIAGVHWELGDCGCRWNDEKTSVESSVRSQPGANGITGGNNANQGPITDPSITLSQQSLFLSYQEFALSRDSLYFPNQEFLDSISKHPQVAENFTHIHFAQELLILERANLFLKNQKTPRDMMTLLLMPKYQSYISRMDAYVKNRTLDDPHRKFCSLLYSMAYNQARTLQQAMGTPQIVDVAGYLETVDMRLEDYTTTETKVVVEAERARYTGTFVKKMMDAMEFIIGTVDPAIEQTFVEMADVTEQLVVAIEKMIAEAEEAVAAYKEAVKQAKQKMKFQIFFDALKLGGALIGLLGGPKGALIGGIIGGAGSIGEGVALGNNNQIRPPTALPESIKKYAAEMEAKYKATTKERQDQLDTLIVESRLAVKENKELLGDLTSPVEQLEKDKRELIANGPSGSLKEFQDINKKVIEGEQTLINELKAKKEFIKKAQNGEAGTPEEQVTAKKWGDKAISRMEGVNEAVKIVTTLGVDMYKNYRNNTQQIERLMKMVKEAEEQVKDVKLFAKAVDGTLRPFTETVINDLDAAQKQMEGQNAVFLRVQQWKVQNVLRKYNFFLQDFAGSFPEVAGQFAFLVEDLQEAMTLMIDLYSFIDQYNEQMQFADYIANINTPRGLGAQFGPEESAIYDKINLALQASLILTEWDTCIQTFQQWVFPFFDEFQANLLTSDIPDYLSPTNASDVLTEVLPNIRRRVTNLKIALEQYKSASFPVIDTRLYFTHFSSELTSTFPFHVWSQELNKDKIRDLLSGKQVTLLATPEFTNKRNMGAVKFTIAEIEPRAGNETIQKELKTLLKKVKIQMTHSGVSKYLHEGTHYQMVGSKQAIHFNFERDSEGQRISRNQAYTKIQSGDMILSPYTLWTVQLFKAHDNIEFEFKQLEKFIDHVDLELIGKGSYVRNDASSVKILRPLPLYYFHYKLSTLPPLRRNSRLQKLLELSCT